MDAAQRLGRRWVGIDITHLAINLIKRRMKDAYGDTATFDVIGEPTDIAGAQQLAHDDPYQFQWWALGLVGARPVEQKKGADRGIDGRLLFHDEQGGETKQVILSVKAGHIHRNHVHELRGVMEREHAAIGVLLSMEPPTRPHAGRSRRRWFLRRALGAALPAVATAHGWRPARRAQDRHAGHRVDGSERHSQASAKGTRSDDVLGWIFKLTHYR